MCIIRMSYDKQIENNGIIQTVPLIFAVCFDVSDLDETADFSDEESSSIPRPTGLVVCFKFITKATSRCNASLGVIWNKN